MTHNLWVIINDHFSEVTNTFGTWDYVIFGVVLAISAGIGIYFAWVDRKKGTKEYWPVEVIVIV